MDDKARSARWRPGAVGSRRASGRASGSQGGRRARPAGAAPAIGLARPEDHEPLRAFLYEAGGHDRPVGLEDPAVTDLKEDALLWADLSDPHDRLAVRRLAELFGIDPAALTPPEDGGDEAHPLVREFAGCVQVTALTFGSGRDLYSGSSCLTFAVGRNWLVSVHEGEAHSLALFQDHIRGESVLGRLDAPSLLAQILEWVLSDYFHAVDGLQAHIDDLEGDILEDEADEEALARLVGLRREIGALRRRLYPHVQAYGVLAHASFDTLAGTQAAADFAVLNDRLQLAIQELDTTREMVVGAFDLFMTQTAQRTNNVMQTLTVISAVLLPATVIAGVLGMNALPHVLEQTWVFYVALAGMVMVGVLLIVVMRWRRWI